MAGSIAWTTTAGGGLLTRVQAAWVSDASGNVSGSSFGLIGTLVEVEFVPDGGGTQPSNNYVVTVTDVAGVDILAGSGAALSNTTATAIIPSVAMKDGTTTTTGYRVLVDNVTPSISAAGNAKGGKIIFYMR